MLLIVAYIVIGLDLVIKFSNNESYVINENVQFGSLSSDVTNTFFIPVEETLDIETYIEYEDGLVCISIINPNNEIVYENSQSSTSIDNILLNVWKGEWKYRVRCEDASNGKYSIQCKKYEN